MIERRQKLSREVVFRADAAFARPEMNEALEKRGVKYAIRIPANDSLARDIGELLSGPVGTPSHKPGEGRRGDGEIRDKSFDVRHFPVVAWPEASRLVPPSAAALAREGQDEENGFTGG